MKVKDQKLKSKTPLNTITTHLNAHPDIFFGTTLDNPDDGTDDVIIGGCWLAADCCHTH